MENARSFSIITVALNNLEGLKNTGASIAGQSLADFEWLVIDGGSDDGTLEWLTDTNATWTSEPDNGIYDAMNKGIARAKGRYLLFLNAGDALAAADTLADIAGSIKTCSITPDFVYGDALEEFSPGEAAYKPARPYSKRVLGMFTHHQAMLYRRETLANLRYDTRYKIAADYDLTLRFLDFLSRHPRGPAKQGFDGGDPKNHSSKTADILPVLYLPQPLCIFEAGGISQQRVRLGRKEQMQIRKENKIAGPLKNTVICAAQTAAWGLRCSFPNLYWGLKSRGAL